MLQKIFIVHGRAWPFFVVLLYLGASRNSTAQEQLTLLPNAASPEPGIIAGTVIDVNDDAIPGATVVLQGAALKSPRTLASDDRGFFEFQGVEPETYRVKISAQGFADWISPDLTLKPSQYIILSVPRLQIATAFTSVTVGYSAEEVATEQVKLEEKQRIFGIIPNFYVSYDQNAAPLTAKLKFQLAAKVAFDPITFIGVGIAAGAEQAGDHPNYPQGWKGFGQRYGAAYTNGFTDIMIGGAILPSLLHRTRATSTKVRGRRSLAFSMQSPSHLSAGETMGGCSRTTRPLVATSARLPSRMPIIQRRIEVSDCFSGTS